MKKELANILSGIDLEIDENDLYGYDVSPVFLAIIHRLQDILFDLQTSVFSLKLQFAKLQQRMPCEDGYPTYLLRTSGRTRPSSGGSHWCIRRSLGGCRACLRPQAPADGRM